MKKTSILTFMLYVLAAVFIFATEYYLTFCKLDAQIYYEMEWFIHLLIQPIAVAIFTMILCIMGNWSIWFCPVFMVGAGAMIYGVTTWSGYLFTFGIPSVAALCLYYFFSQVNVAPTSLIEKIEQKRDQ